ncbi:50S ribosomal protein L16 [archaeon]|nr:50S ribosomal protein L16 [archaeon]
MGDRPGRVYRDAKNRLYTRKEYMRSTPQSKITIFDMGDLKNADNFEVQLSLVAREKGQITHNALEASRISSNRYIQKHLGPAAYVLKCRVYPHIVLRENKMASGAGADRISDGMRLSFGKAISLAANVKEEQKLITIGTSASNFQVAKDALKRASHKLPMPCRISVDKGKEILKL